MQMSMQMNDGNNDPNRVLALFLKPSENKENKRRLDNETCLKDSFAVRAKNVRLFCVVTLYRFV